MDLNYIRKLVKLLSESDVDEIEIEEEGKKIRLVKRANSADSHAAVHSPMGPYTLSGVGFPPPGVPAELAPFHQAVPVSAPPGPTKTGMPTTPSPQEPPPAEEAPPAVQHHEIKSPIVGTFYRAPAPEAAPFVQVGSTVGPGTVLCIVEAMKLMNEIECDISGKIVKILVENGQPIEYDQTLFLLEEG
jgi:acetyl-CoA carboxylase biotin carboxyl carrier protein